jgi:hypothetical protein
MYRVFSAGANNDAALDGNSVQRNLSVADALSDYQIALNGIFSE